MIVLSSAAPRQTDWRADPRVIDLLRLLWRGGAAGHLWRKPATTYWLSPSSLKADLARLDETWTTDCYFGVHPTGGAKSAYERARAEDIAAVNCLYADFDDAELAHIEAIQPAPSVIVASGGGYHAYWLLAEPITLGDEGARADWAQIQRWWVRHVGADPAACDLARLLRVPGTWNGKYDPPREVRFVRCALGEPHDNAALMRHIADARAAELAQERSEHKQDQPAHELHNGASPIEQYNGRTNIRDALREHGYTLVGERYFVRPGKDPRQGISGTIDDARNRAYTFSTHDPAYDPSDTSPSGAGCTLRPFDLLCRLRFGGDAKAAVRWLIEGGEVSVNGRAPTGSGGQGGPAEERPPEALTLAQQGGALAHRPALSEQELHETRAGELLALNFGAKLRYTPGRGWLVWDGMRWHSDTDERAATACAWLVGGAYLARALEASKPLDRQFLTFGKRVLSAQGARAVLEQGRKRAPVAADDDGFDRDPWLLNTPSGIVDLRTGELRPHDPRAMLTRVTNAPYDPQAKAPRWERFLREVFGEDEEIVTFARRWLGYCLTGDMREQRYLVAWGGGANGKSTLFNAVRYVMGDYAADVSTDALAAHRNAGQANPDIAKLPGVRLAIAPEWDEALRADETLIKNITGGDPITTRYLYRNTFTFTPACKLIIFGNAKPALRGTDAGTWRRPVLLPFTQQFTGERADKRLPDMLRAEAAGILADLVRGCLEWQSEGLHVPEKLEQATQSWRSECDDVREFVETCCVREAHARATVGALHQAYREWGGAIRTPKAFGRALRELGYTTERTREGYQVQGVGLRA